MACKNENKIRELHEKVMKEFVNQIDESISSIPIPIVEYRDRLFEDDATANEALGEEEHSGPDKIYKIRNEAAATQLIQTLNPDEQLELMEIVKQKSEEFECELRCIPFVDIETFESSTRKFKEELMHNVHNQLTLRKYALQSNQDSHTDHAE